MLLAMPVTASAYTLTEYLADQGPGQAVVSTPPGLRVRAGVHEVVMVATVARTDGVIHRLSPTDDRLSDYGIHGMTAPMCDFSALGGRRHGGSIWTGSFVGSATVRCHERILVPPDGKPIPFGTNDLGEVAGWIYAPIAGAGGLVQIYALNGSTPAQGIPNPTRSILYSSGAGVRLGMRVANTGSLPLTAPIVWTLDNGEPTITDPSCDFSSLGGPSAAARWDGGTLPVGAVIYCTTTLRAVSGANTIEVMGQFAAESSSGFAVALSGSIRARGSAPVPKGIRTAVSATTRRVGARLSSSIVVALRNTSRTPALNLSICVAPPNRSVVTRLSTGAYWNRAWCWQIPKLAGKRATSRRIVLRSIRPKPAPSVHVFVRGGSPPHSLATLTKSLRVGRR